MKRYPKSPYLKIGGMVYLPRMLDKMRMHLAGELPEDYHGLRGKGMDERACKYLRVEYDDVLELAEKGWDDEAIAGWVSKNGRDINEIDILIWNSRMCTYLIDRSADPPVDAPWSRDGRSSEREDCCRGVAIRGRRYSLDDARQIYLLRSNELGPYRSCQAC